MVTDRDGRYLPDWADGSRDRGQERQDVGRAEQNGARARRIRDMTVYPLTESPAPRRMGRKTPCFRASHWHSSPLPVRRLQLAHVTDREAVEAAVGRRRLDP